MDASLGEAQAAEILDMDFEETEDSNSTCTEENNHVSIVRILKLYILLVILGCSTGSYLL